MIHNALFLLESSTLKKANIDYFSIHQLKTVIYIHIWSGPIPRHHRNSGVSKVIAWSWPQLHFSHWENLPSDLKSLIFHPKLYLLCTNLLPSGPHGKNIFFSKQGNSSVYLISFFLSLLHHEFLFTTVFYLLAHGQH